MAPPSPSRSQLAAIVAVVVAAAAVGAVAWGFAQQLGLAGEMRTEAEWLEQAVAADQARSDELAERLALAESDEYVEAWARVEAGMVMDGEVAVVPLAATVEQPTAESLPVEDPAPKSKPFWVKWWALIFGPSSHP